MSLLLYQNGRTDFQFILIDETLSYGMYVQCTLYGDGDFVSIAWNIEHERRE